MKKVFLKIAAAVSIFIFSLLVVIAGMFYSDFGRQILVNCVVAYLKSEDISIKVDGVNKELTKVQNVLLNGNDGMELQISDITLERDKWNEKSNIVVDKIKFREGNNKKKSKNLRIKFSNVSKIILLAKKFVSGLEIKNGSILAGDDTYVLKNITYKMDGIDLEDTSLRKDTLRGILNDKTIMNMDLIWDGRECVRSDISFEKLFGFDGNCTIRNPEESNSEFNLLLSNDDIKISASGNYKKFMKRINILSLNVKKGNQSISAFGRLYIEDRKSNLIFEIDSNEFTDFSKLPHEISKNFEDIKVTIDMDINFKNALTAFSKISFKKNENEIGKAEGIFTKEKINLKGDISWINIHEFHLKNFKCEVLGLSRIDVRLFGEDFVIKMLSNFKNGELTIANLKLDSQKGFLRSKLPIKVGNSAEYSFNFDFKELDFWKKVIPISGQGKGNFFYRSGKPIEVFGKFENFSFKDYIFSNLEASATGTKVRLTSSSANLSGKKFKDLDLKIDEKTFDGRAIFDQNIPLRAIGEFSNLSDKFILKNSSINLGKTRVEISKCDLDFKNNNHVLECRLSSGNSKKNAGHVSIRFDGNDVVLKSSSVQLGELTKFFSDINYDCEVSGELKLNRSKEVINGHGDFSIIGLVTSRNRVDLKCDFKENRIAVEANLKNVSESLNAKLFLPIFIKSDGTIQKNLNADLLNCKIFGKIAIENFLQLPDETDIRGNIDCNLSLLGSLANPTVTGTLNIRNANILIDDISLRNGRMSFIGKGSKLILSEAEFIDYRKQKLIGSGYINLFSDGLKPNLFVDLKLNFLNFALFDSDKLNIRINGKGTINGPINDLQLSGKVDVPFCKFQRFGYMDDNNEDIIIENEKHVIKKNEKNDNAKSPFKYNVQMNCPRVECVGNIYNITLSGNLNLETFNDEPTLNGILNLKNGRLDLLEKRMSLSKGYVKFFKEYPFDPEVFFSSRKTFEDMSVRLEIKNKPKEGFSFLLFSNPIYPTDVILSKMLFGKELSSLSVTEAAQLARVVAGFKQQNGIFSFLNTFQKIGIVDTITFSSKDEASGGTLSSNTQTSTDKKSMNLKAGKYLHDNIFVSVNNDDEGTFFDVDMSVSPKFFIRANSRGEAGVSWKYRY